MFNAPIGYHQLADEKLSQEKVAFQGVDAIKWTYTIMPFGPTNGLATFINFIHDIDSVWKDNAKKQGITISNNTNTKIIVDDIVSWAENLHHALGCMRCQLKVCQAYNLLLNLCKSFFFAKQFEFIGVDMCNDNNCTAQSKHSLLKMWPAPEFFSVTSQNSLALPSSTPDSFLTLRCMQNLCTLSINRNTPSPWQRIGHLKQKELGKI
jgi:hypothetical protein